MQATFRYDVFADTAADTFALSGGIMPFEWAGVQGVTRIMEMTVWDNPAMVMLSYDGTTFGPEIELDQDDPPMQLPHAARAIQIRNKNPGSNSRYQIVGFW